MPGRTLVMLLLVYAVSYMDRQLLAILIEPIKHELAISDTAAGLLYGLSFAIFFTVLGLPIAWLADRSNRSRIIVWSLALFSAMTALCGGAATYLQLLLARIGVGVGEAGTGPASQSMIADLYPLERRGSAMAMFSLGPNLGILLGFLFGGYIGEQYGWRAAFLLAGVVGLILSAIFAGVVREPVRYRNPPRDDSATFSKALLGVWRSSALFHLFAGATLISIAGTTLVAWLPAFLMRIHEIKLSTTGALLAGVFGVLGAGGTLLSGWLADRWGARAASWRLRGVVIATLIGAPTWTVAITAQDRTVALVAIALAGTLAAFHLGPTFAMVQSLAPRRMRAMTAALLILVANLIGIGLGPYLVGMLSDFWSSQYGAKSLRPALMIVPPLMLWAAVHYEVAARALGADLKRAAIEEAGDVEPAAPNNVTIVGAHSR